MTVYVDDAHIRATVGSINSRWSHMTADSDDELHGFAAKIGMKRSWFQEHRRNPLLNHYDLTEGKREQAIKQGAVPITWREAADMRKERQDSGEVGLPACPTCDRLTWRRGDGGRWCGHCKKTVEPSLFDT